MDPEASALLEVPEGPSVLSLYSAFCLLPSDAHSP